MWRNKGIKNTARRQMKGFTLIEVLVAMAIFAAMSIAAYQVLNQVQRSNEISQERTTRVNELQRALVIMDSDFRQMVPRKFRTNGKDVGDYYMEWQDYLLDSDSKGIMFIRDGWANPQEQFPRGNLAKVGYRLKDKTLERVWWHYPDTTVGEQPVSRPLLTGVESWSMRFYVKNKWTSEWEETELLPQAIEVTIQLQDYGKISRIYLIAGPKASDAEAEDDSE
ncbi:type II secretion system protein GspJ [Vibrio sp. CAIM 722]|uniref:Type II secretion system protein J n=1 Tax=Vibrio eleionomae TaxID=2653505 RepID=A0A7X4RVP0_9VIBR|nr:type II secretion system minor pseudopilin GspJ [Vibrio eleionomae]MZI94763.1 type II secretion system protein GspJ [Vibrio eleionomae]